MISRGEGTNQLPVWFQLLIVKKELDRTDVDSENLITTPGHSGHLRSSQEIFMIMTYATLYSTIKSIRNMDENMRNFTENATNSLLQLTSTMYHMMKRLTVHQDSKFLALTGIMKFGDTKIVVFLSVYSDSLLSNIPSVQKGRNVLREPLHYFDAFEPERLIWDPRNDTVSIKSINHEGEKDTYRKGNSCTPDIPTPFFAESSKRNLQFQPNSYQIQKIVTYRQDSQRKQPSFKVNTPPVALHPWLRIPPHISGLLLSTLTIRLPSLHIRLFIYPHPHAILHHTFTHQYIMSTIIHPVYPPLSLFVSSEYPEQFPTVPCHIEFFIRLQIQCNLTPQIISSSPSLYLGY